MFSAPIYLHGLAMMAIAALCTWVLSLLRRNVAIVDSLWPLLFLIAALTYAQGAAPGGRAALIVTLVAVWALRLSIYITWRSWGRQEDRRYQAIRARNEPHFPFKSLYLVFAFQALLAWTISLPLLGAELSVRPLRILDVAGMCLWVTGFVFEAVGDWQLARFKADAGNLSLVMDKGLWRFTRHPNYFGDFCIWWGFYCMAASAGAWWSIIGPVLMSILLLRVSGVTLLEKDIGERRPGYADYVRTTNAFFPGNPKQRL